MAEFDQFSKEFGNTGGGTNRDNNPRKLQFDEQDDELKNLTSSTKAINDKLSNLATSIGGYSETIESFTSSTKKSIANGSISDNTDDKAPFIDLGAPTATNTKKQPESDNSLQLPDFGKGGGSFSQDLVDQVKSWLSGSPNLTAGVGEIAAFFLFGKRLIPAIAVGTALNVMGKEMQQSKEEDEAKEKGLPEPPKKDLWQLIFGAAFQSSLVAALATVLPKAMGLGGAALGATAAGSMGAGAGGGLGMKALGGAGGSIDMLGSGLSRIVDRMTHGKGILSGMLTKAFGIIRDEFMSVDVEASNLVKHFGGMKNEVAGVSNHMYAILNSSYELLKSGTLYRYDIKEVQASLEALGEIYGNININQTSLVEQTAYISKALGVRSGEAANFLFTENLIGKTMALNAKNVNATEMSIRKAALTTGTSWKLSMKDLVKSTDLMVTYGRENLTNIIKATAEMRKMGLTVQTLTTMQQSFGTFDSALEKAAQLNALTGSNIDAMKLFTLAATGNVEGMRKEFMKVFQSGKEVDGYTLHVMSQISGLHEADLSKMQESARLQTLLTKEGQSYRDSIAQAANVQGTNLNKIIKDLQDTGDLTKDSINETLQNAEAGLVAIAQRTGAISRQGGLGELMAALQDPGKVGALAKALKIAPEELQGKNKNAQQVLADLTAKQLQATVEQGKQGDNQVDLMKQSLNTQMSIDEDIKSLKGEFARQVTGGAQRSMQAKGLDLGANLIKDAAASLADEFGGILDSTKAFGVDLGYLGDRAKTIGDDLAAFADKVLKPTLQAPVSENVAGRKGITIDTDTAKSFWSADTPQKIEEHLGVLRDKFSNWFSKFGEMLLTKSNLSPTTQQLPEISVTLRPPEETQAHDMFAPASANSMKKLVVGNKVVNLSNKDNILATTNDIGSLIAKYPEGALSLPQNKELVNQPQVDNIEETKEDKNNNDKLLQSVNDVVEKINSLAEAIKSMSRRPIILQVDGKTLATVTQQQIYAMGGGI